MKRLVHFFAFGLFILATSCSPKLTPYSQGLADKYRWSEEELKQIQFYLSDNIVLQREVSASDSRITQGKIKIVKGREIEEVVFKKGTPGVFVFSPKKDRLAVSFDAEDGKKFLIFGPNQKMSNHYVLLAKEWDRNSGSVTYNDKIYTTGAASAFATLMVDLDRATSNKYKSSVAKGRKVN